MMRKISVLLLICSALIITETNAFGLNRNWLNLISRDLWRSRVQTLPLNRTECVMFRNESLLSCVGNSNVLVECPAVFNFTDLDERVFDSFAVGLDTRETMDNATVLHLYPRLGDYPFYMVSQLALRGIPIQFCLFDTPNYAAYGVRVTDTECFNSLLRMLRSLDRNEIVTLKSFEVVKPRMVMLTELYVV